MSIKNKQLKAELSKYSKADIIDAVCHGYMADRFIQSMLTYLRKIEQDRLLDAEAKAWAKEKEKGEAYARWNNEMCQKYGDGKSYMYSQLPESEIHKGAALSRAWNEAMSKTKQASKKADRAFEM